MYRTTEIASHEEISDNVIHQRLLFPYAEAAKTLSGDVLEAGCGAGRGIQTIAPACTSFTGLDKNKELMSHLAGQFPHFSFRPMSFPPFGGLPDSRFDAVVTYQVIEHIENDELFVKELHRVLRPGGKLYLTTPNRLMSLTRNPWHVREYEDAELKALLKKYFSHVEMMGITGNEKVMRYYEQNKESVKRITRWDVLNLQYRLPRQLLQIPYDILNRINRKKLLSQDRSLVADISIADYQLTTDTRTCFDFYCVAVR